MKNRQALQYNPMVNGLIRHKKGGGTNTLSNEPTPALQLEMLVMKSVRGGLKDAKFPRHANSETISSLRMRDSSYEAHVLQGRNLNRNMPH